MSAVTDAIEVIGWCRTPRVDFAMEATQTDLDRPREFLTQHLRRFAFPAGGTALIVSLWSEMIQYTPVRLALHTCGLTCTFAEATPFDAYRVAALLQQFKIDVLVGLRAVTVEALAAQFPDAITALGRVPAIFAEPSAAEWLDAHGIANYRVVNLGPVLAFECSARAGFHYDGGEWSIAIRAGEALISSHRTRRQPLDDVPTGLRARVEAARCTCGSEDPRIRLEPS